MATSTTKLGLTKPDFVDVVDVSELNTNADAIDAAVGATIVTSATRPASPWAGQIIYETDTESTFVWTGSAWIASGGGASVTVSETAPAGADEGDLWLNSTEAKMYVYYDDGTSEQWVAAVGGTVPQQGKILQVVNFSTTTTTSTTSTSYVNTALTSSITPNFATSKILIFATAARLRSQSSSVEANVRLYRGDVTGTDLTPSEAGSVYSVTNDTRAPFSIVFEDSPATTSSVTYTIGLRSLNPNTTEVSQTQSMVLMEVAG